MRTAPTDEIGPRHLMREQPGTVTPAEAMLAAGADYLAAMGAGLALVDRNGRVLRLEGAAADLLDALGVPSRASSGAAGTVLSALPDNWLAATDAKALCLPVSEGGGVAIEHLPSPADGHGGRVLLLRRCNAPGDRLRCVLATGLTPRQAQTLLLLGEGLGNKAIARRLGISPGTVKKHLEAIYAALSVDGRTAAVAALRDLPTTVL